MNNKGAGDASSSRTDPWYCLRCQTLLKKDLHKCPQCNLSYDAENRSTYLTKRMFLRWQFWLPGYCFSVLIGFVTYAVVFLLYSRQGMGYALFFAVPTCFGAILGYMTRSIKIWWVIALSIVAVTCLAFAITSSGITGIFCGLTLGAIFLGPALIGVTLGGLLRKLMLRHFSQKFSFLPIILLTIFPVGNGYIENKMFTLSPPNSVQTSFVINQPQIKVWQKIRFYEAIKGNPPLLLKLGLPKPIGTVGTIEAVGSLTKCLYNKGHYIVKRINRYEEGKLLSFDVVEQHIHFEHDVTLLDGIFFYSQ